MRATQIRNSGSRSQRWIHSSQAASYSLRCPPDRGAVNKWPKNPAEGQLILTSCKPVSHAHLFHLENMWLSQQRACQLKAFRTRMLAVSAVNERVASAKDVELLLTWQGVRTCPVLGRSGTHGPGHPGQVFALIYGLPPSWGKMSRRWSKKVLPDARHVLFLRQMFPAQSVCIGTSAGRIMAEKQVTFCYFIILSRFRSLHGNCSGTRPIVWSSGMVIAETFVAVIPGAVRFFREGEFIGLQGWHRLGRKLQGVAVAINAVQAVGTVPCSDALLWWFV